MKNLFVPYSIAIILREKGFDEPVFGVIYPDGQVITGSYEMFANIMLQKDKDCIPAPIYQQVTDWLRDTHKVHIWVSSDFLETSSFRYTPHAECGGKVAYFFKDAESSKDLMCQDYYEALNTAIETALKRLIR